MIQLEHRKSYNNGKIVSGFSFQHAVLSRVENTRPTLQKFSEQMREVVFPQGDCAEYIGEFA